ncbi:MAG: hypothetical protein KGR98_06980 [Verrucomicrobia bacterium]|nr:hypothetical protein [Verrucomicrobiota bacterium]
MRHSFISYRLDIIKNVHQVCLEAGNSPSVVFAQYRQLVRESEAKEWFPIVTATQPDARCQRRAEFCPELFVEAYLSHGFASVWLG